ncbi:hypothetical protein AC579_9982 [Pseudocercospora musae]|uniref:F-box domain-containing protein n=1 Tax=Pseudocercospora musae TaxID=113226 RepID=A0A139I4Q4_9PEZI|nr:hypothetical protein AC579_9982 [Pseudocercospora musae]
MRTPQEASPKKHRAVTSTAYIASSSSRCTRRSRGLVRPRARHEYYQEWRRQRAVVKIQKSADQTEIDETSSDPNCRDTLQSRLPVETWCAILSYLDVTQLKELRAHSGFRNLIDANQEAIVRRTINTELSRLSKDTEQANSQPPEFVRALRQWLCRYGICERCYSAAHYDDLAAFVWHWFSRRTLARMNEQPKREDFSSMSTACRYIIALEVMPLEPDLVKRIALTRQYSDQLHRILLHRQDWFALQGMDQVNALLERLEDEPDPYPADLCCGGRHIVQPMTHLRRQVPNTELLSMKLYTDVSIAYRPLNHVLLVPLRNEAKISSYERDADREQALQRMHNVLGMPRLMESASATYYAPMDANWVKEIIDRIQMGDDLKLEPLERAQILEAIIVA